MQYQSAGSHDFCAQIRFRNSANPNGIASQSPGLRGTSYPGQEAQETTTPAGWRRPRRTFTKAETPLEFCSPDPLPQGSSCLATLGFVAESRWDSRTRHFQKLDLRPDIAIAEDSVYPTSIHLAEQGLCRRRFTIALAARSLAPREPSDSTTFASFALIVARADGSFNSFSAAFAMFSEVAEDWMNSG